MNFPNQLKELRKMHHLTQREMSDKLNMEQSSYSRYETGKTIPTANIIERIVETFHVTYDWLIYARPEAELRIGGNQQYSIPKDIVEVLLSQQKSIELLLQKVAQKL